MATGGGGAHRTLTDLEHEIKCHKFNATFLSTGFILAMILAIFDMSSPFICIGLSSWRLWHRAHAGASIGEASLANLTKALTLLYALVLCQGVLFLWLLWSIWREDTTVQKRCKNISREEWFKKFVKAYTKDIRERCAKDLAVAEEVSLLSYAVGLLESGSQEEYLSAARMLDCLIKNGQDASALILGSRRKAKRLLDTLGITQGSTELRLLAARIVADLAGGIRLAQFPGSLQCVSLLEATDRPELIVQGLTILQRLARDPHNCVDICKDEEHSDIVGRLTRMLDSKNIRYRAMPAQILENLCIHCKEHVSKKREILLPKVLAGILATETKTKPEASGSIPQPDDNEGTHEISSEGNDIEMQLPRHTGHKASDQENEDDMRELQEALLSLTFVIIHEELISSDNFARAVHENAPDGALVDKLKAIVDDNC
ncbi:hypothetical protein ABZP36_009276 [Zizania latifolia]